FEIRSRWKIMRGTATLEGRLMSSAYHCVTGHHWQVEEPTPAGEVCPKCGAAGQPLPPPDEGTIVGKVQFSISGKSFQAEIPVPRGRVYALKLLPVFQELAEVVVAEGVRAILDEGKTISCTKGCGACCR